MSANLINNLGGSAGFGENFLYPNDDSSSGLINLSAIFSTPLNFYGNAYTGLFVNNNGTITFEGALSEYTPFGISGATQPIIAPFFADVDTRGGAVTPDGIGTSTGSNLVYWDIDTNTNTFTATWDDVGYYSGATNKTNAFQVQIINKGAGNFDIEFRYEDINWTTGNASGGSDGLGGTPARAGYASGTVGGINNIFVELSQSGNQQAMLDLDETGSSIYRFSVVNGDIRPTVRTITFGDPHLVTFDGLGYDFQTVGEFTLFEIPARDIEVQVRQSAMDGSDSFSVNSAIAVRDGSNRVQVSVEEGANLLLLDGVVTDIAVNEVIDFNGTIIFRSQLDKLNITFSSGDGVELFLNDGFMNIIPTILDDADVVRGLLGNADHNTANDFALRDGTILNNPTLEQLYGEFADSWRITNLTSLFTYAAGQDTSTFTDLSFPSNIVTIDDLTPEQRAFAESVLAGSGLTSGFAYDAALLDIALSGNPNFASGLNVIDDIVETALEEVYEDPTTPVVPTAPITLNIGTARDDFFILSDNAEIINLYGGRDVVAMRGGDDVVYAGDGNDEIYAGFGNDSVWGQNGDDFLSGAEGNDLIYGGAGNDTIYGGLDNDTLFGGDGNDKIFGGDGNDSINGNDGDDVISGGTGNDKIFGGDGNDSINGNDGDDVIYGGLGADILTGGNGADSFRFNNIGETTVANTDVIQDFQVGVDNINLVALNVAAINYTITGSGTDYTIKHRFSDFAISVHTTGGTLTQSDIVFTNTIAAM